MGGNCGGRGPIMRRSLPRAETLRAEKIGALSDTNLEVDRLYAYYIVPLISWSFIFQILRGPSFSGPAFSGSAFSTPPSQQPPNRAIWAILTYPTLHNLQYSTYPGKNASGQKAKGQKATHGQKAKTMLTGVKCWTLCTAFCVTFKPF